MTVDIERLRDAARKAVPCDMCGHEPPLLYCCHGDTAKRLGVFKDALPEIEKLCAERDARIEPTKLEALALLVEELGESVQAVGKILRHGLHTKHPRFPEGLDNSGRLAEELGHVAVAAALCVKYACMDPDALTDALNQKLDTVDKYLTHISAAGIAHVKDA